MAQPCLLCWDNAVVTGSLSSGSELPALGSANLQNVFGSADQAWQTASGVLTYEAGAWLLLDCGAQTVLRVFSLHRTNLSAAAMVRWRVWASADQTATPVIDTGLIAAQVAPYYLQHVFVAPFACVGRYVRLDILDPSNPDGFVNVAQACIGPAWQPVHTFGYASSVGRTQGGAKTTTRGGQVYARTDWISRAWKITLASVERREVWARLMDLDRAARLNGNVLFVPNPDAHEAPMATLFGLLEPSTDVTWPQASPRLRSWSATLTERL